MGASAWPRDAGYLSGHLNITTDTSNLQGSRTFRRASAAHAPLVGQQQVRSGPRIVALACQAAIHLWQLAGKTLQLASEPLATGKRTVQKPQLWSSPCSMSSGSLIIGPGNHTDNKSIIIHHNRCYVANSYQRKFRRETPSYWGFYPRWPRDH